MEKFNAIEKEWINSLEGTNTRKILNSIYEIRNSGSVKILPHLLNLVNKNTDPEIRNEIFSLLSEIKSGEAVPLIAESLHNMDFGDYLNTIVATCWQSGLDFSKHFRVFVGLFIQADYKTALEAFTVIEESLINASKDEIHDCLHFLKESECMVSDEKLPLYLELRKVVEDF